jgi:hypothetical protein
MQIDIEPFPVNIIELTNKKVLVQPEVTDKDKGKNIVIGDPRTLNTSREVAAQKAPDKKTNMSEALG